MENQEDNNTNNSHDIWEQVFVQEKKGNGLKHKFLNVVYVFVTLLFLVLIVYNISGLQNLSISLYHLTKNAIPNMSDETSAKITLQKKISVLQKQVNDLIPKDPFIIVNSFTNRFFLYKDKKLIREGICSTGTNVRLLYQNKKYLFATPKGVRKVTHKRTNPPWIKPDWAFIEEGLKPPSARHPSRTEENVLGDYGLYIGDGYLIHGTIYQRQLGMPASHGCVRIGDADLEVIYNTLIIGSNVYIY